jgi:hypothetical protein
VPQEQQAERFCITVDMTAEQVAVGGPLVGRPARIRPA